MQYPEREDVEAGREKRCRLGGRAARGGALVSLMVVAHFVWMLAASWSGRSELADWRFMRGCAEAALARRDFAQARLIYLQIEHVSLLQQDWQGLIVAACGLNRLDGIRHAYSRAFSILVQAAAVAEKQQSRRAMSAIAAALDTMGHGKTASVFRARVRSNGSDSNDAGEKWQRLDSDIATYSGLDFCSPPLVAQPDQ